MTDKFVPVEKMTKAQRKAYNDSKRVRATFNTGTQVHKDARHPSRAQRKASLREDFEG